MYIDCRLSYIYFFCAYLGLRQTFVMLKERGTDNLKYQVLKQCVFQQFSFSKNYPLKRAINVFNVRADRVTFLDYKLEANGSSKRVAFFSSQILIYLNIHSEWNI